MCIPLFSLYRCHLILQTESNPLCSIALFCKKIQVEKHPLYFLVDIELQHTECFCLEMYKSTLTVKTNDTKPKSSIRPHN